VSYGGTTERSPQMRFAGSESYSKALPVSVRLAPKATSRSTSTGCAAAGPVGSARLNPTADKNAHDVRLRVVFEAREAHGRLIAAAWWRDHGFHEIAPGADAYDFTRAWRDVCSAPELQPTGTISRKPGTQRDVSQVGEEQDLEADRANAIRPAAGG
jgi:hypothetical protein